MGESLPSTPKTLKDQVDPELQHREERAEKVVGLMDRLHAADHFGTAENRKRFLETLSYEELKRTSIFLNDALRGKGKSESFDGGNVQVREIDAQGTNVSEYIPPDEADKEPLLGEIVAASKGLEIQDAALLLAAGINAVHPFEDGNGRLARFTLLTLGKGYDGSDAARKEMLNVLGPDGKEYLNPDTKYVTPAINAIVQSAVGIERGNPHSPTEAWSDAGSMVGGLSVDSLPISVELDAKTREALLDLIEERSSSTAIFFAFLKEQGMLIEPFVEYKEVEGRAQYGLPEKWTSIQIDEVLQVLSKEQIMQLLEKSREIRKMGVKVLVRIFTQPERFKVADGKTLKEVFREKALAILPR